MPRPERSDIDLDSLGPDPERAGAGLGLAGTLLALAWLGGIGLLGYGAWMNGALATIPNWMLAGGAVVAALPGLMILFAASAAREGARSRAHAARLAAAADKMLTPSPAAEASARKVGVSVRGEIAALDRALDQVVARLREVESVVARQTLAVDNAVAAAQTGARQMAQGLERERAELAQIAHDLNEQANLIGEAISRHTRMIAEATRMAEAEVRAADEALEARLTSFGAAAALISDRTQALNGAAQSSAEAALRLESILSHALDALAKATSITDAARQSAEAATQAANATAGAMRETSSRAVDEARRAAELIRSEGAAIEREAALALSRLQEAAVTARDAALAARTAVEGAPQPTRSAAAASPLAAAPAPVQAQGRLLTGSTQPTPAEPDRTAARSPGAGPTPRVGAPGFAESLTSPQTPPARPAPPTTAPAPENARWTWREVLSQVEDTPEPSASAVAAPKPREPEARKPDPTRLDFRTPSRRDGTPLASVAPRSEPPATPDLASAAPGASLVAAAGLRLGEVFSAQALERIGQKARGGTQARRRAVREAAPEAVERLARTLDTDDSLRAEAAAFLKSDGARIAELLGRGRASLSADATRAFLLVDAAAS